MSTKAKLNSYARVVEIKKQLEPLIERFPDGTARWRERPNMAAIGRAIGCSNGTVQNIVTGLFGTVTMPERERAKPPAEAKRPRNIDERIDRLESLGEASLAALREVVTVLTSLRKGQLARELSEVDTERLRVIVKALMDTEREAKPANGHAEEPARLL